MIDTAAAIRGILEPYPTAGLPLLPTPIHPLSRISECLGRPIWVMRDDLTGYALGGNKIRKLDFLIGDALNRRADTLVVSGASSFSRNAAAAGRRYGLSTHVLLVGTESEQNANSQSFFRQFDTCLHYVGHDEPLADAQDRICSSLAEEGRRVYPLHPGGSDEIGTLGYVLAYADILEQSQRLGVVFDRIVHASGSAATQAGLVLGSAISGSCCAIIGMAISQPSAVQRRRVQKLAEATAIRLGVRLDSSRIIVDDRFLGPGYPLPSEESRNAVSLFATEEGLLLDPVYGGKAAAGLIALARHGEIEASDRTLFIHTGGNAGVYY